MLTKNYICPLLYRKDTEMIPINNEEEKEIKKKTSFTLAPSSLNKLIKIAAYHKRSQSSMMEIIIDEAFEKLPAVKIPKK